MSTAERTTDIAVIGMACRFPDAETPEEFWRNLRTGRESVSQLADQDILAAGVDPAIVPRPDYVKAGVLLKDIELFDAAFFAFSAREAEITDPQHRLFLECAWETFENAGYAPGPQLGRAAVYASAGMNTYLLFNLFGDLQLRRTADRFAVMVGNDKDFIASRVAYKLNLTGPSITVQTACSSSLVAVHLACQSLLSRESDLAMAGGAAVRVPQKTGYLYQPGGILSPDGHCRAFDESANGTIFGSGVAAVLLKPLHKALADRDHIHAVIKGSAANNDGSAKVGFTAPSVDAQTEVIVEALAVAGVSPETVSYIEAHGTGTPMGDPIEIAALTQAFRTSTRKDQFCAIGSVKTAIGHLDVTAGIAGLIKTILALENSELPPSLHFEVPNPKIQFETTPFFVNAELRPWLPGVSPRRAGVSSFGIGGTNVHLVVEEAPRMNVTASSAETHLITVSAKSVAALGESRTRWAKWLEEHPDLNLRDVAYTSHVGRKHFPNRAVVLSHDRDDAIAQLREEKTTGSALGISRGSSPPLAFLFPGQGAQFVEMGRAIHERRPEFRRYVDRCAEILKPLLNADLRDLLYPAESQIAQAEVQLNQTALAQPALFVTEFSLARTLMEWGLTPTHMLGHSVGEYVGACLAGVFSLEDALTILAFRGQLIQSLPPGAMLAVMLAEGELRKRVTADLAIAAVNAPEVCVVSGSVSAIAALEGELSGETITTRRLHTSHAFHSAMMDPILESFTRAVSRITLRAPRIPFISNVTGSWITDAQAMDPQYWATHLRKCVRFDDGLQELIRIRDLIALEVGPGAGLSDLFRARSGRAGISTLRRARNQTPDDETLLRAVGEAWRGGVDIDWDAYHRNDTLYRIPLPTYPFERQRYWIEPTREPPAAENLSVEKRPQISEWFYVPTWRRSTLVEAPSAGKQLREWLVFAQEDGASADLLKSMTARLNHPVIVRPGTQFKKIGARSYEISPSQASDYEALLSSVSSDGIAISDIAHLWSVEGQTSGADAIERFALAQQLGFESVLLLTQALSNAADHPIRLSIVTCGLQEVTGNEVLRPENATLLGASIVGPQELPHIKCRTIDLDPGEFGMPQLIRNLECELVNGTTDDLVSYRGGHRWLRDFEPVNVPQSNAPGLRQRGTFLITGGTSGIGLELAEFFANEAQANLVLIGRSAFPEEEQWSHLLDELPGSDSLHQRILRLRRCQELGAKVLVLQADVANESEMSIAIATARQRFGEIHGVIHAAGVAGGGLIGSCTLRDVKAVLRPKIQGTLILEKVLRGTRVDFCVLCSSINAIVGGVGQSAYCAANAFLDAFAQQQAKRNGCPILSVNWDTWSETGMALRAFRTISAPEEAADGNPPEGNGASADQCFTITLNTADWLLNEHRILDRHPVMPGAAFVHLVSEALDGQAGYRGPLEFTDVYFHAPLVCTTGSCQVKTSVIAENGSFRFEIRSDSRPPSTGPTTQIHVSGKVTLRASPTPSGEALDAVIQRCRQRVEPTADQRLAVAEAGFGPRWDSLRCVHIGHGELLAELELPADCSSDIRDFRFHPALLDVATGFARLYLHPKVTYLPLAYEQLQVFRPFPEKLYSHVRLEDLAAAAEETLSYDVILLDSQGQVLAKVEGFTLKKFTTDKRMHHSDLASVPTGPQSAVRTALGKALQTGISNSEGVEAFRRLLSVPLGTQVLVSPKPLALTRRYVDAVSTQMRAHSRPSGDIPSKSHLGRHARPAVATPYRAAETSGERRLAALWKEALGLEDVGIDDDFFSLGGDSVLAIQLAARARQEGLELSPQRMFEFPTIAGLAAQLGSTSVNLPGSQSGEYPARPFALSGLDEAELERVAALVEESDGPAEM